MGFPDPQGSIHTPSLSSSCARKDSAPAAPTSLLQWTWHHRLVTAAGGICCSGCRLSPRWPAELLQCRRGTWMLCSPGVPLCCSRMPLQQLLPGAWAASAPAFHSRPFTFRAGELVHPAGPSTVCPGTGTDSDAVFSVCPPTLHQRAQKEPAFVPMRSPQRGWLAAVI